MYFVKATTPFVPWEPCSENICLQKHTALLGCLGNISSCSVQPFRVLRSSDAPARCRPCQGSPTSALRPPEQGSSSGIHRQSHRSSARARMGGLSHYLFTTLAVKTQLQQKWRVPKMEDQDALSALISASSLPLM